MPFSQSLLSAAGSTKRIALQQVNTVSISANSHSCADPASTCAAVQVIAVSLFQCGMAWAVRNCSWGTIFGLGWAVSGFCNQNLFCAQHELSHFLAFKKPSHNKLLSILSNCPLVVPTATTFRKYHQEHHSHLVCSVMYGCTFSANYVCEGAPEACAAFLPVLSVQTPPKRAPRCVPVTAEPAASWQMYRRDWGRLRARYARDALTRRALQQQPCLHLHGLQTSKLLFVDVSFCLLQGVDGWDVDLPTYIEANVICSFLLKLSWVCCYIIVYGLRPVLIRPKRVGGSPPSGMFVVPSSMLFWRRLRRCRIACLKLPVCFTFNTEPRTALSLFGRPHRQHPHVVSAGCRSGRVSFLILWQHDANLQV